jgi:ssDNA-binding Zn-finger/Zn-ribbon topoisomerase 1
MGRRRKYSDKEFDLLDKLKHENAKLKKQVSSLRKQIQRIDLDRYENLKDLIYKHYNEDLGERIAEEKEKLKKKWECKQCGTGFLKIYLLNRLDGMFYYRKCTECSHRTKPKPYTNKVEGIKADE